MVFAFDNEGLIERFENHATLDMKQWHWLHDNFPFTFDGLERMKGKTGQIEEDIEITFDLFWDKYDHKHGKVKAREKWNKLDDNARYRAIQFIPRYTQQCNADRIAKLYPQGYLSQRRWEDSD